ncbi:MAG: zinc dependent phospholipase C family protein [Rhodospirillaceae bacterium]
MAGGFAHMVATNQMVDDKRLNKIQMPDQAKAAVCANLKFCELGAVAPDYPYLKLLNSGSKKWADNMHYIKTGDMIKSGISQVRKLASPERERALAWLLGYTSHVVMDLTIHPVVNARVGPYSENQAKHRSCEVNQDAYILPRLNIGSTSTAEYIKGGIATVDDAGGSDIINKIWVAMLSEVYPDEAKINPPDPKAWHAAYTTLMDKIAEEGQRLPFSLGRHLLTVEGLAFPRDNEIDQSYIYDLISPGGTINYDELFNFALENVGLWWGIVGSAVYEPHTNIDQIVNGDLDTGKLIGNDLYVFWSNHALTV